jgi:hypothetical protein
MIHKWLLTALSEVRALAGELTSGLSVLPAGAYGWQCTMTGGLRLSPRPVCDRLRYVAAMRLGALFDFCQVVLQMRDVVFR